MSKTFNVTRRKTLPDSASKTDFHDLIDGATTGAQVTINALTTTELSSSAGIVDTQLATISTAGKVTGASLTQLNAIPSGAGVVPVANLGSGTPNGTTVLYGDGAWTVPTYVPTAGMPLQVVYKSTSAYATTSVAMPVDDSIPAITEGGEVLSQEFTPTKSSSKIKIDVSILLSGSGAGNCCVGIFQNGVTNSLAASGGFFPDAGEIQMVAFSYYGNATSTDARTYSVRAGMNTAIPLYINGTADSTRVFGGVASSSMTITEIKA